MNRRHQCPLKSAFHLPWTFLKGNEKQRSNTLLSLTFLSDTHLGLHFTFLHAHTFGARLHLCKCMGAFMYLHWMCEHPCTRLSFMFFNILDIVLHKCRLTVWAKILAFQGENATFMDLIFSTMQFRVEFRVNGEYFFEDVRIWNQETSFSIKSLREQSYLRIFRDFFSGFIMQKLSWKLCIETFID